MNYKNIYVLGIGGSGMSSIGKYLKQKGMNVVGYDQRKSFITNLLKQDGIDVVFSETEIPYDVDNLYIYSSAISIESKKFSQFHGKENVISRPEFLEVLSKDIPAICHIDNTCRVQTLKKSFNPHFYNLIKEFNNITKIPILLNTSFNLAGDTIVETVDDAINTLSNSDIDYVYFPEKGLIL